MPINKVRIRRLRRDPNVEEVPAGSLVPALERRQDRRHESHQYAAILFDTTRLICDLIDLSETGAKLRVVDGIVPSAGQHVGLILFDGTTVEGEVTWLAEGQIGVSFFRLLSEVASRLEFEDQGRAYFGMAANLQRLTRDT